MGHPNHTAPDQYTMETLEKIPMEDKLILSREEDYPFARELTPGEIARIVNNALRELPGELVEESGPEIADACQQVAYEVMGRFAGFTNEG